MESLDPQILAQFTGTETWYKGFGSILYTEGVRYVADTAGAYWWLSDIFAYQLDPKVKAEEFQVWKLLVEENGSAKMIIEDGNKNLVVQYNIAYTDFPEKEFTLWFTDNVILLPSEY